jgi:hypothetical protein
VQGWLDIFDDWDPTVAFVMGGAIVPMALVWNVTRECALALGGQFPARPDPVIDRNLVIGSVLFGVGGGLSGLCRGPALALISFGVMGGGCCF